MTHCIVFEVKRCEMVVREGQQLQQIAAIYHSDWLQLWSHNHDIAHPDMQLSPHQVLHIGHMYDVQPFDKPIDVAKRFGMDAGGLRTLNADLGADLEHELCGSMEECNMVHMCILPNSCTGMSSSLYHSALKMESFYPGATDGSS